LLLWQDVWKSEQPLWPGLSNLSNKSWHFIQRVLFLSKAPVHKELRLAEWCALRLVSGSVTKDVVLGLGSSTGLEAHRLAANRFPSCVRHRAGHPASFILTTICVLDIMISITQVNPEPLKWVIQSLLCSRQCKMGFCSWFINFLYMKFSWTAKKARNLSSYIS
jgi:hypothetical protein